MDKKTRFIFIDEAGNVDFSAKGTKYFVLTGICTLEPLAGRDGLARIKYDLLGSGKNIESFHASEDKQCIRNRVFAEIENLRDFEIHSVIADKRKTHPSLYRSEVGEVVEKFYKQVCETLLQYILQRFLVLKSEKNITDIVVVLDNLFRSKKRDFVTKHIKQSMKNRFAKTPYVYFHQMKSDINCQISDYCCWAIFVKWNRDEMRPYSEIVHRVQSEFDLFRTGTKRYYRAIYRPPT